MQPEIAYILPSFSNFEYSRASLLSLHRCNPDVLAIIIDDASPDWDRYPGWWLGSEGRTVVFRYPQNGGLTRSWNAGVSIALQHKPKYIVCGNNDVLFSPDWSLGLCAALDGGYALVGPVSNAPGVTAANNLQHVRAYLPRYTASDDPKAIASTARSLAMRFRGIVVPSIVNGFFMMAKAETWRQNGYTKNLVFPPLITSLPTGKSNRTPAMTGQEDWLQFYWYKKGMTSAIVPSSFIFHYRSVSRGIQYAIGDWMRKRTV